MNWILPVLALMATCAPVCVQDADSLRQLADHAAIKEVWQLLRKGDEKRYVAGGFGRSEDRLVKRDGEWLIKSRKLTVFTD